MRIFKTLALGSLILAALNGFIGCASQTPGGETQSSHAIDTTALSPEQVDKLLIVDCLLPGQVRKLGQAATYIAPRRPVKTSALDCEIRGGEYVAYDRADYATALKVWLPPAKEGSAEAQTYVGEIYEKGLGIKPDYGLAAQWYRKAADQGYARAQINLGYLYEKGLGVEQNLAEAMNWYRRASGLTNGELEFVSTVEASARTAQQEELQSLRTEVTRLTEQAQSLNEQLSVTQSQLSEVRKDNKVLEKQLNELQRRKDQLGGKAGAEDPARQQLEQEYQRRKTQLEQQRTTVARLEQEQQQLRAKLGDIEAVKGRSAAGPTIEVMDPMLALTRGIPSVRLRSIQSETQITGRVTAPAGLKNFLVNDHAESLDTYGSFRVRVPIQTQDTKVVLIATDKQGRQASMEFVINAAPAGAVPPPASPSLSGAPGDVDFGSYYAVIIGNDDYARLPKLRTAVNDARLIDRILRERYGFRTTLLINADRRTILTTLYQIRDRLSAHDNLLIYYAGHGEIDRVNDRGYWLPIDADAGNPGDWISNDAITDMINTVAAKHVMVIVDSCYSGTLSRTAIAQVDVNLPEALRRQWLRLITKSRSRTVLTSGGLQPVLDEGGGSNSVFAQAVINALANNRDILQGYSLYRRVADTVTRSAQRMGVNQVPEYAPIMHAGHETGQFFFVPKA